MYNYTPIRELEFQIQALYQIDYRKHSCRSSSAVSSSSKSLSLISNKLKAEVHKYYIKARVSSRWTTIFVWDL